MTDTLMKIRADRIQAESEKLRLVETGKSLDSSHKALIDKQAEIEAREKIMLDMIQNFRKVKKQTAQDIREIKEKRLQVELQLLEHTHNITL
jgi:hypothetical protein